MRLHVDRLRATWGLAACALGVLQLALAGCAVWSGRAAPPGPAAGPTEPVVTTTAMTAAVPLPAPPPVTPAVEAAGTTNSPVPAVAPVSAPSPATAVISETRIEGTPLPTGPAAFTAVTERDRSADYRIGEEDELAISVYGDPELSKTQTVRPGGKISLPLVGDVVAVDRTPEELRSEIMTRLERYIRTPRVTVIVAKYNSRKINVLGEVRSPGLLVLSSDITLLEAIARAGGLSSDADLHSAILLRRRQSQPVSFERLFRYGDASHNVLLEPDDTILIPNVRDKKVVVLGQVQKPLVLPLTPGLTLSESISRAGGLTEDADLGGALLLRRGQVEAVDFDKLLRGGDFSQNIALMPDDTILIPSLKDKKVFVLGQVSKPTVVTLTPGLTLVESISRAGGITDDADLQGALLVRDGTAQPIDFDRLLRHGDLAQNALLHPNDLVVFPSLKDRKVFVLGEVNKPSVVALRSGVTLVEAIAHAGGFTADARKSNVIVVRGGLGHPTLLTIDVDALTAADATNGAIGRESNVPLQPGDIVYTPRSKVANVVKFFENLTKILMPVILTTSGIVLAPAVWNP